MVVAGRKEEGIPRKEEGRVGCRERNVVWIRWIDGVIMHRERHVVGYRPFVYR